MLRTGADGRVRAEPPVGAANAPIGYVHHDQVAGSYRPLWRDLPGLGRAYRPATRRAVPLLVLPYGIRAELPQATWYFHGPAPAGWDLVASYPAAAWPG